MRCDYDISHHAAEVVINNDILIASRDLVTTRNVDGVAKSGEIQICLDVDFENCYNFKLNAGTCNQPPLNIAGRISSLRVPHGTACSFFDEGFCKGAEYDLNSDIP